MRTTLYRAAAGAAIMLALTGCAPTGDDGAAPGEAAAKFVACLKSHGARALLETDGTVRVMLPGVLYDESTGELPDIQAIVDHISVDGDTGEIWIAPSEAAAFDDPDTRDAYAACEAEHPDFAQPRTAPEAVDEAEMHEAFVAEQESALRFARCARDAGFAWVSDPEENDNTLLLPADVTEAEFRSLLTECWKEDTRFSFRIDAETGEPGFDWIPVWDEYHSNERTNR
jgi:hypothetical protein